jgi:putative salt-induced outer membrane protein
MVAAFFGRWGHGAQGPILSRGSHGMVKKRIALITLALLAHGLAQAADAGGASTCACDSEHSAEHPGTWAARGQLGLILTSGNTSTKSGNATLDVAHKMGRWTLSGGLGALYASTGHYTTQQDTTAHLQADLELSARTFWFSTARWDRNLFTGFAYQESVASGAGVKFLQSPATLLAVELGAGYRAEKPETLTIGPFGNVISRVRVPGSMQREAVLQGGLNYAHSITRLTKVVNTLLVQYGSSDTTTTDNLALQVKVDASLSLAVGVQVVNNTHPPATGSASGSVTHTNTLVTVNLVYDLKNPKLSATAGTPETVNGFNLP